MQLTLSNDPRQNLPVSSEQRCVTSVFQEYTYLYISLERPVRPMTSPADSQQSCQRLTMTSPIFSSESEPLNIPTALAGASGPGSSLSPLGKGVSGKTVECDRSNSSKEGC